MYRRGDPEVPIVEAVDVAAIAARGLPHAAAVHAAVSQLVEILQSLQLERAGLDALLDVAEVLPVAVDDTGFRIGVQNARALVQHLGSNQVVGVQRQDVAAQRRGNAGIARRRHAAAGLRHQAHGQRGVLPDQRSDERARVVGAAVVDQHDFEVAEALHGHAGHRFGQERRRVVAGDDHADSDSGTVGHAPRV
jgi:hypothetical protein